jgi:hypothetical protein
LLKEMDEVLEARIAFAGMLAARAPKIFSFRARFSETAYLSRVDQLADNAAPRLAPHLDSKVDFTESLYARDGFEARAGSVGVVLTKLAL